MSRATNQRLLDAAALVRGEHGFQQKIHEVGITTDQDVADAIERIRQRHGVAYIIQKPAPNTIHRIHDAVMGEWM